MKRFSSVPWTIPDTIFVLVFFYGTSLLFAWWGRDLVFTMNKNCFFIILFMVQQLCLWLPLYLIWRGRKGTLQELGFKSITWGQVGKLAFGAYGLYWIIMLFFQALQMAGLNLWGMDAPLSPTRYFSNDGGGYFVAFSMLVLVAPFSEEIFFRGFFLNAWDRWGSRVASIVTAFVFSLIHGEINSLVPLLVLGLILSYTYYQSGRNLWPCLAFHVLNNVVALTIAIIF